MYAGQRKIGPNNYEVMLFPLDVMYITQGETPAHGGTLCMDFVGYGSSGQIPLYPYYAPCSCTCVAKGTQGDWVVFTSNNPVYIPQSNIPVIVTWQQGHDNTPCNVGDTFTQGDLIGHTGTRGQVSGDHLHFNTVLGTYQGWDTTTYSESQLVNSIHIYDCCYVDDTDLIRPLSYPWVTYGETPPIPTIDKKKKFPWYIIAHQRM